MRRLLKERLRSDETDASIWEDLSQNKDYLVTRSLIQTFRRPLHEYDASISGDVDSLVLTYEQRKPLLERAMQEIVGAIQRVRSHYLKLQQIILDIDENSLDGKPLTQEADVDFLHLNRHKLDRSRRLVEIASRVLSKCGEGAPEDVNMDAVSVASDELVAEQADIDKGDEDIDGIEITQEVLNTFTQADSDEYVTTEITDRQLKDILKQARIKKVENLKRLAKRRHDEE